jgi:hypothetical protein
VVRRHAGPIGPALGVDAVDPPERVGVANRQGLKQQDVRTEYDGVGADGKGKRDHADQCIPGLFQSVRPAFLTPRSSDVMLFE